MSTFKKTHKHHLRIWFLLIGIAVISGYIAYVWQPAPFAITPVTSPTTTFFQKVTTTPNNTSTINPAPKNILLKKSPTTTTPSSTTEQKPVDRTSIIIPTTTVAPTPTISAIFSITTSTDPRVTTSSYTFDIPAQTTVYDFMKLVARQTTIRFTGQDSGNGLGFFVTSINGIASDPRAHMFWIYYINNKKATLGISSYTLQAHDIITWKYEHEI